MNTFQMRFLVLVLSAFFRFSFLLLCVGGQMEKWLRKSENAKRLAVYVFCHGRVLFFYKGKKQPLTKKFKSVSST